MANNDEMMALIKDYVTRERARLNIQDVGCQRRMELSGEQFGEMVMLLDQQLILTHFGYGAWDELNNLDVLEGVYLLVARRQAL